MSDATAVLLAVACFLGAALAMAALISVVMSARRTARAAALVRDGVERTGGATAWVPGHGITEARTDVDPEPDIDPERDEPTREIRRSSATTEQE